MTTVDGETKVANVEHFGRLTENIGKVEALSRRLMEVMARKDSHNPALNAPGPEMFSEAAMRYWTEALQNPARLMEHQVAYWGETLSHFAEVQKALVKGSMALPEDTGPSDPRFRNPMWDQHPFFNFIKQQYLINARAIEDAVESIDTMDQKEKQRLTYFARQIVDLMAPTNFFGTNPDALEKALETDGESLVKGLENLVADLEANGGELVVRLADETAFEIGRNIATTPGKVVFRNRMMELIQYEAATEKVHQIPLIIFPPWINKFYILDLKKENSLIRWITEQGYTLFVVSWINPDESYADVGMADYVEDGFLTAIREVKAICGTDQVNAVGYCIAGTTLACTLSAMKQAGDTSVKSATFFTALTDFSDQGEFTPFLADEFIDGIADEIGDKGYLRSYILARTFSYLRSNDLVYQPAIRSYMLGEAPPAFDLLYWNGDGSNLPGRMAIEYLRDLVQKNQLAAGAFELSGRRLSLKDVDVPICSIACETDHIAAWKDCYRGVQLMGGRSKTFILTQSGHIAGIVNPPSKKKYGHYTNDDLGLAPEAWREGAEFHEGSWWPRWESWLRTRSGKKVAARKVGDSSHKPLADAPGTYVAAKAKV